MERETQEGKNEDEEEKELGGKRDKPVVRPEEIPPVPENRFLLRRDMPSQEDKTEMSVLSCSSLLSFFKRIFLVNTVKVNIVNAVM